MLKIVPKRILLTGFLLISLSQIYGQLPYEQVIPFITLEYVKPYWDPLVDQSAIIQKEKSLHNGLTSNGAGGYFAKIQYTRHPRMCMPIEIRVSFMIEKDPYQPMFPIGGKYNMNRDAFKKLRPLTFKVDGNGDVDYSFWENDTRKEQTHVIKKRTDWDTFDFFLNWQLFSLWQFNSPDKPCIKIAIYVYVEVFDMYGKLLGTNKTIPIVYYVTNYLKNSSKREDLGTEDLSGLFDDEPEPPTPELGSATDISEISEESTTDCPPFEDTPPTPPEKKNEQHKHEYVKEVNFEIIPFQIAVSSYESYPENVTINFSPELEMEFNHKAFGEENNRYISHYVLTKGQWAAIMEGDDSHGFSVTDKSPFTDITIDEAIIFVEKVNLKLGDEQQLSIPTMETMCGTKGIGKEKFSNYVADELAIVPGEGLYLQLHVNSGVKNTVSETHYKVIAHKKTVCKGCRDVNYKSNLVYRFRTKEMAEHFINRRIN